LHRFVDGECQGVCWRTVDPVVLWAVCAALFLDDVKYQWHS
jgi:hypothetical protein